MVWEESVGLHWESSLIAAIVSIAPSTALAHSSASALPGELALLGTVKVVGFGELAVVIWKSESLGLSIGSVLLEVIVIKHLAIIEVEEVDSDGSGSFLIGGWTGKSLSGLKYWYGLFVTSENYDTL